MNICIERLIGAKEHIEENRTVPYHPLVLVAINEAIEEIERLQRCYNEAMVQAQKFAADTYKLQGEVTGYEYKIASLERSVKRTSDLFRQEF